VQNLTSTETAASATTGLFLNACALPDEFAQFVEYFLPVEEFSTRSLRGAAFQFRL
jgi:hypothetical protein